MGNKMGCELGGDVVVHRRVGGHDHGPDVIIDDGPGYYDGYGGPDVVVVDDGGYGGYDHGPDYGGYDDGGYDDGGGGYDDGGYDDGGGGGDYGGDGGDY